MAELHGKTGAIYAAAGIIRATTISFTGPATISDSGNGFVTAGFVQAQKIIVTGSDSNDNTYTIATGGVAAGALTTTGTPNTTNESAGDLVTIYQAAAGSAIAGCTDWTVSTDCTVHDVTTFEDLGIREYLAGLQGWTGTAKRFWQQTDDRWGGNALPNFQYVRFFTKYVAIPTGGNPAYYYEGLAIVTSIDMTTPAGEVIGQNITFQGVGSLTLTTATAAY